MSRSPVRLLLACLTLASSPALAQDYGREGPYVGLAGSLGIYTEVEDEAEDFFGTADVETPVGLNARAGYRLHPHFAAEGEFEWLSEADVEVSGNDVVNFESFTGTANGKAFLLTGRVQPFALLGIGFMVVEGEGGGFTEDEADFAARFGGGLDFYITREITAGLSVSYVLPADDLDDFDYVSIGWGLGYRF